MTRSSRRLTSLAAIVMLAGSPNVFAACAALCPGMSATTAIGSAGVKGVDPASTPTTAAAAQSHEACAEMNASATPSGDAPARLTSARTDAFATPPQGCCTSDDGGVMTAVVDGRAAAHVRTATAAAPPTVAFAAWSPSRIDTPKPRPPVLPHAPARSPLVLRI